MDDIPDGFLDGVGTLLTTARRGSATQAAEQLGTTPATVLRRLQGLEEALGVRLFDRSPRGLIATPALARVLPWAEQIEAAAIGMQREVQGLETTTAGIVRLALLPILSSQFVVPALAGLRAAYPDLVLELVPANAIVDLDRREADLALRTVRPEGGELVVQRLASFKLAIVCSAEFRWDRGPRSLEALPWLAWDERLSRAPESQWLSAHVPQAKVVLRSSDVSTLLRAAQLGLGALVVAEPIAAAVGGLVHVPIATPPMPEAGMWLVAHQALRPVPRVAAVWDWLRQLIETIEQAGTARLGRAMPHRKRRNG